MYKKKKWECYIDYMNFSNMRIRLIILLTKRSIGEQGDTY